MSASFGGQWSEMKSGTSEWRNLDTSAPTLSGRSPATLWRSLREEQGGSATLRQCPGRWLAVERLPIQFVKSCTGKVRRSLIQLCPGH